MVIMYFLDIVNVLTVFARAGGGGSSSGSGDGDGGGVIFGIPGALASGVAAFVKKKSGSKLAAIMIGYLCGILFSLVFLPFGVLFFFVSVVIALFMVPAAVFADSLGRFRKNSELANAVVEQAAARDQMWDKNYITQYATSVFNRFQYDWEQKDLESIKQYSTENYARHVGLMLYAMQQMGRTNVMRDIRINEVLITRAEDSENNTEDRVGVGFVASANDVLIDDASGEALSADDDEFGEQWNFVRSENGWLLDGIDQNTEDDYVTVDSMRIFAQQNGLYYSPDWGRLLLPTRGQLFSQGSFKTSDVNNHIIGFWEGNLLVQLYTYVSGGESEYASHYIVGQITLPKSYGGILVQRNTGGLFGGKPKAPYGYNKVSMEWGDFNERYSVFATDENQVTSFELLNPAFMAWLYDRDLQVNIEVVDNVVYLYSEVNPYIDSYADMLEVLRRSHKELKM